MRLVFDSTNKKNINMSIVKSISDEMKAIDTKMIMWDGDIFRKYHFNNKKEGTKESSNTSIVPIRIRSVRERNMSISDRLYIGYKSQLSLIPIYLRWFFELLFMPIVLFISILIIGYKFIKLVYMMGKKIIRKVEVVLTQFSFKKDDVIIIDFANIDIKKITKINAIIDNTNSIQLVCLIHENAIEKDSIKKEICNDKNFESKLRWVSDRANSVLFGTTALKNMFETYWENEGISIPVSRVMDKVGIDVCNINLQQISKNGLNDITIPEDYIIAFGDFCENGNQDLLYRVYAYLYDVKKSEKIPSLLLIGNADKSKQLTECIKEDPRVSTKIKILPFVPEKVGYLINNAQFVLIPDVIMCSKYIFNTSLELKKDCIVSDISCLNDKERSLVYHIEKDDVIGWANNIYDIYIKREDCKKNEELESSESSRECWREMSDLLLDLINNGLKEKKETITKKAIYYDLTLAMDLAYAKLSISGIPRTQLILARKIWQISKKVHFFAIQNGCYIEINVNDISEILDENIEIDKAFRQSSEKIILANTNVERKRFYLTDAMAMIISVLPDFLINIFSSMRKNNKKEIRNINGFSIKKGDIVISTGTGFHDEDQDAFINMKKKINFIYYQLLYDFTTVVTPQTHTKERIEYYEKFFRWTYAVSDVVFYGGEAAMKDGMDYIKANNIEYRPGKVVRFGSDIGNFEGVSNVTSEDMLKKYKIGDSFLLTVGSIEPRKNYETIYLAYLYWLRIRKSSDLPQIVIAGYPGWKSEDFLARVKSDLLVKDKIIICTPSDEELDYLYRNCKYTILASQYEGWSLTVPQSMKYNKFCLASNVNPLLEVGRDFLDYVHPLDVRGWAKKMDKYYFDKALLIEKETKIKKEWHSITWDECARKLYDNLCSIN